MNNKLSTAISMIATLSDFVGKLSEKVDLLLQNTTNPKAQESDRPKHPQLVVPQMQQQIIARPSTQLPQMVPQLVVRQMQPQTVHRPTTQLL